MVPCLYRKAQNRAHECQLYATGIAWRNSSKSPRKLCLCGPCMKWVVGDNIGESYLEKDYDLNDREHVQILQQRATYDGH